MVKVFSFSISTFSEYSGLISFRIDWFDLLAVQMTLKSLLQHHSSKASFLQHSGLFMVQLSSLWLEKPSLWLYEALLANWCLCFLICHLGLSQGFPDGASGKETTCQWRRHKRCGFDPWVRKIPWRRKWQPTPVFLPGRSHGQSSLVGYSLWCPKESDMTEYSNSNKQLPS